ncbi:hypothetical protein Bbelb_313700 [Branchiostoma belcheri]|nr:hypothetical protein Bbelb_313700 [Branchiostoma belcheri]
MLQGENNNGYSNDPGQRYHRKQDGESSGFAQLGSPCSWQVQPWWDGSQGSCCWLIAPAPKLPYTGGNYRFPAQIVTGRGGELSVEAASPPCETITATETTERRHQSGNRRQAAQAAGHMTAGVKAEGKPPTRELTSCRQNIVLNQDAGM